MSGRFFSLITATLIGVFSAPLSAMENASPWEKLVREAYSHSPELRAAHARWQASAARPAQALSLPDPTVSYGYFVQRMETRQRFSIQQMFPGGGRRGLEAKAAIQAAHGVEAELETTAARVRTEVLKVLAEWHLVLQSHALIAQNLDLVLSLEAVATQRYRAGEASQADLLRLQSEADILRADLADWEDRRTPVLARLNARLGRPVDSPADAALETLTALPPLPASVSSPDFATRLTANPTLREGQHLVRQAELQREISRRANRPDFMVGLELMDNRGMARDEVVGMVGVNLPIWRTRTAALRREANANLQAAEHNYTARRLSLEAEARQLLFAQSAANRRIQLYDDALIPRARRTLSLIESDYRTNRTSFLDLLEARRTLLALEQAALNARVDRFGLGAEWEQLAGPYFAHSTTTPSSDE